MIRLDSVTKQHGRQVLFLDASCAIFRGDKVGLVGPNGAGKSTIFRMIVREEAPDGGQVVVDRAVPRAPSGRCQPRVSGRIRRTGPTELGQSWP